MELQKHAQHTRVNYNERLSADRKCGLADVERISHPWWHAFANQSEAETRRDGGSQVQEQAMTSLSYPDRAVSPQIPTELLKRLPEAAHETILNRQ